MIDALGLTTKKEIRPVVQQLVLKGTTSLNVRYG